MERFPESLQVLYAELLDQLRQADKELHLPIGGSFVSKKIGPGVYWYLQRDEGGRRTQTYLGPESPDLLEQIRSAKEQQADQKRRRQIVAMLAAGGATSESARFASVLQVLADSFVFRLGGVLVGTQAFKCYANMLGVRFTADSRRTAENDRISIGITREASLEDLQRPKKPTKAHVDFLTTTRRGSKNKPVPLPHLNIAAEPLEGLEYLIEKTTKAAVLGKGGILVNVPIPARYALHKLWVARNRPVSEQTKARKDIAQAQQVLEVLATDRPDDIEEAATAMQSRPKMWKRVREDLERTYPRAYDAAIRGDRGQRRG